MHDTEVIESKLNFLREYLGGLKEYETISLSNYRRSKKDQRFVERTLHLACECCIDIAAHIIIRRGLREPRDNKDLFLVLFENENLCDFKRIILIPMDCPVAAQEVERSERSACPAGGFVRHLFFRLQRRLK
jgi:hypothetical protein